LQREVLSKICKLKDAASNFNTAPHLLGLSGYSGPGGFVGEPMDLNTVKARLEERFYPRENKYTCIRAFDRDMLLIWDNCIYFNEVASPHFAKMAERLQKKYNEHMEKFLERLRAGKFK
jgi:hypothetical protein